MIPDMDKSAFEWWSKRVEQLEQERDEWKETARRLSFPHHDPNCEFAAPCSYCSAMKRASIN
jgi:hypothetical protein